MNRLTGLAVAALMLSLSLTGREVACDHERQAVAASSALHEHGQPSDAAPSRPDDQNERCDDTGAMCCEAITSCVGFSVSEPSALESKQHFAEGVRAARNITPSSTAAEVATPPPRRV